MIDTKSKLYTKMSVGLPTVDIFHQSDDENDNKFNVKFPMITYKRIALKQPKHTERAELYQVTARHTKAIDCEALMNDVVELLHNSTDTRYKSLRLFEDTKDIYDPDVKAYGIAMTFLLITQDVDL